MKRERLLAVVVALVIVAGATYAGEKKTPPVLKPDDVKRLEEAQPAAATAKPKKERKVLVFWRCEGFFHGEGIAWGNKAIELAGKKTGAWTAECTDDYAFLAPDKLAGYDAVVFNNTTGLKLSPETKKGLLDFVESGKGVVGIHAATDNFGDWPDGAKMMGGLFSGHPWGAGGTWAIKLSEPNHPLAKCFGGQGFKIKDELYQYKDPYTRADRIVLLQIDLSDAATGKAGGKGNRKDGDYAMAWVKTQGKGRIFYNGLGHNPDPFLHKAIAQFNLEGIQFALGDLDVPATPQK